MIMVVTMMMMMMLMTMMVLMMVTMTIMFMMKNLILLQKCEVTKLMKLFIWSALHEQTEMILNIILVIFLHLPVAKELRNVLRFSTGLLCVAILTS